MRVLHKFTAEPQRCHYLPSQQATMDYVLVSAISAGEYEQLMNRGYRKFGICLFRPVCETCQECRPIRVPVAEFQPDRSQRRTWKRNQDLEVRLGPAKANAERLALYDRYHRAQQAKKGWPETVADADEYLESFVNNPLPNVELSLREDGVLRAVLLADVTPNAVSAIYHYHDPAEAERGLGTYCILQTINLARQLGRRWAYMGFYVKGCASMEYKARFNPCEIMDSSGNWVFHERSEG